MMIEELKILISIFFQSQLHVILQLQYIPFACAVETPTWFITKMILNLDCVICLLKLFPFNNQPLLIPSEYCLVLYV